MTRIDPLQQITAQPWRYDYFSAMRWLENYFKDEPRFGTARKPSAEPVRLGQAADLSFAPSSLHAVMHDAANGKARIEVRFFGLFGPNGPLPHHLRPLPTGQSRSVWHWAVAPRAVLPMWV